VVLAASDPWTDILNFLQTVIVPNWTELISMLPFFLLIGVVGPILSLLLLMQLWYLLHRRRGRVRITEPEPRPALRDANGNPVIPPNVPFCDEHALLHPLNRTICEVDGAELSVVCPVDETVRPAAEQLCRACGTRYVLGATRTAVAIRRTGQPPAGGAAVA
jgi:hypothetical protein